MLKLPLHFLRQPVIVGAMPYQLTNGALADANPVMANFNYIATSVNSAFYVAGCGRSSTNIVLPVSATYVTIIFNDNSVADPLAEWNTTTGIFTPHYAGLYQIYAQMIVSIATGGGTLRLKTVVGSSVGLSEVYIPTAYNGTSITLTGMMTGDAVAGSSGAAYVALQNQTGGDVTVIGLAADAFARVTRIGG